MRVSTLILTWLICAMPLRAELAECSEPGIGCVELTSSGSNRKGAWRVEIDLSEFGDTHDVFLSTTSEKALRCGEGHATLFIRCFNDRTSLFLWHGCVIPSGQTVLSVDLSIDGEIDSQEWEVGGDPATLGLWLYDDARRLIEAMFGAERLALRYEDPLGLQREMAFPIAGLENAIVPLRLSCGWSDDWPRTG
jgi:type VI secretion system protein VasI